MRSFAVTALLCMGMGAMAPVAWTPAAWAAPPRTLHIALRQDTDTLDPALTGSYVGRIVLAGLCDKLFDFNQKLQIVPQLATGYTYKDKTHLVIHLRKDVQFQDGETMTATAVKDTLLRDLTMKGSLRRSQIDSISRIKVIDPLTVELVLKAPSSPLLAQLAGRAGMILAPHAIKTEGAQFGLHPVCAGPFSFVSRTPQGPIVLKRFPGYWNAKAIHFDRVVYEPIPNSAVRLADLQAGAVDLVEYVVPTDIAAVKRDPKLRVVMSDWLGYNGITFNTGNGPSAKTALGQNALVRRAFALAIDRKALAQVVFNGVFTATAQAVPPGSPFYVPTLQAGPRDIPAAQKLLKRAGVHLPVPVVLTVANEPDQLQVGQVVQAMAKPAGFAVTIKAMEAASSFSAAIHGQFQAYLDFWSGRADADSNLYQFLHTGGGFNYGHYSNPLVDRLLDEARLTSSVARRRALYAKMYAQEQKDMPLLYLWTAKNIVGIKKSLRGFIPVPDGIIRLQGMSFAK